MYNSKATDKVASAVISMFYFAAYIFGLISQAGLPFYNRHDNQEP